MKYSLGHTCYLVRDKKAAREFYEEKLGLVASYKENQKLAANAVKIIDSAGIVEPYADKLKQIIQKITE